MKVLNLCILAAFWAAGLVHAQPAPASAVDKTAMFQYKRADKRDLTGFADFDAAANGAKNIKGNFKSWIRVDSQSASGKIMSGVYTQEPASAEINWPFTEHAFVLEGVVVITDLETGKKVTYRQGDGWVIKQGSRTLWDVKKRLTKSFFLVTQ